MEALFSAIDMLSSGREVPDLSISKSTNESQPPCSTTVSQKDKDDDEDEENSPVTNHKDSASYTQVSEATDSSDDDETLTSSSVNRYHSSVHGDKKLSWRLDPKQSYSDCTIEVVLKSSHDQMPHVFTRPTGNAPGSLPPHKVQTYHVHRSMLAYGPRRSLFFVKLFQKNYDRNSNESDDAYLDKKYQLYFSKAIAKTFPVLLDFMYSVDEKSGDESATKHVTPDNVIALNFLSKVLQITSLRNETESFYEANLDVNNCYKYYQQAHALNGQKIIKAVTKTVINNLDKIKLQSDLLVDFNALSLWKHVVQSRYRNNTANESIQISTLITCFCKLHRSMITKEDFVKLTDARFMPVIHYQVALPLLEISKELRTTEATGNLNRLQIRCLEAFVKSWKVWMMNSNFAQTLSKLNVYELYYLLNSAMESGEEKAPLVQSIRDHQAMRKEKVKPPPPRATPSVPRATAPKESVKAATSMKTNKRKAYAVTSPPLKSVSKEEPTNSVSPIAPPLPRQAAPMQSIVSGPPMLPPPNSLFNMSTDRTMINHPNPHMNPYHPQHNHHMMIMQQQREVFLQQQREMCWNEFRKRKQFGMAPPLPPPQLPPPVPPSLDASTDLEFQQAMKKFRPGFMYPNFLPPQQLPPRPPPFAAPPSWNPFQP